MGHREDLLAGAVRCLREKGYARTTARDIVAASGTNLASIGYHYGSTQALLNAAVFQAMEDFGAEIGQVMRADAGLGGPTLERLERFWAHVIDSFRANPGAWLATFDVFGVPSATPRSGRPWPKGSKTAGRSGLAPSTAWMPAVTTRGLRGRLDRSIRRCLAASWSSG